MKTHTANGNEFYYVKTIYGFMCSFTEDFEDIWFTSDLDSDSIERIDGSAIAQ